MFSISSRFSSGIIIHCRFLNSHQLQVLVSHFISNFVLYKFSCCFSYFKEIIIQNQLPWLSVSPDGVTFDK